MPKVMELMQSSDVGVAGPTLRALYIASQGGDDAIVGIIEAGVVPYLAHLLESSDIELLLVSAIKTMDTISTNNKLQVNQ